MDQRAYSLLFVTRMRPTSSKGYLPRTSISSRRGLLHPVNRHPQALTFLGMVGRHLFGLKSLFRQIGTVWASRSCPDLDRASSAVQIYFKAVAGCCTGLFVGRVYHCEENGRSASSCLHERRWLNNIEGVYRCVLIAAQRAMPFVSLKPKITQLINMN